MAQPTALPGALLVGGSEAHTMLMAKLRNVAPTDAEVLISGATGTGKELYANYLHQRSARAKAAFVPVNCGGLPVELFENELFGHVGGAFTGARQQSDGLVAAAEGGTLFFDEIDSLPLSCQVKLLRFLQEKEYRRLGETRLRHANVRIVAATNTDLVSSVRAGRFREDLFFRLRVVPVEVPPLSQRVDDIPLLVDTFAERCARTYNLPRIELSDEACEQIERYDWPGNIRELENCVKYLTCVQLGRPIRPGDLPLLSGNGTEADGPMEALAVSGPMKALKNDLINQFERSYLESALRGAGGNIAAAARASGKPRRAFFELMRKRGITKISYGGTEIDEASELAGRSRASVTAKASRSRLTAVG